MNIISFLKRRSPIMNNLPSTEETVINSHLVLEDVLREIFSYLDVRSLSRVSILCKQFHEVACIDSLWRIIVTKEFSITHALHDQTGIGISWRSFYIEILQWKHKFDHYLIHDVVPIHVNDPKYDYLFKLCILGD